MPASTLPRDIDLAPVGDSFRHGVLGSSCSSQRTGDAVSLVSCAFWSRACCLKFLLLKLNGIPRLKLEDIGIPCSVSRWSEIRDPHLAPPFRPLYVSRSMAVQLTRPPRVPNPTSIDSPPHPPYPDPLPNSNPPPCWTIDPSSSRFVSFRPRAPARSVPSQRSPHVEPR
ncbi:hypothetical protein BJ508DRAFT_76781 [Ascobolus immersus RN42]|uniref:Uncharacterized protein n=1 Tax=Ascobolus immersus RN42 TaxID=1160509 RepID=A0A3N4HD62_ASCIM|nr:hypothetical protein BJ508DRAFT_76781 [Ascobolus immersus RN42]